MMKVLHVQVHTIAARIPLAIIKFDLQCTTVITVGLFSARNTSDLSMMAVFLPIQILPPQLGTGNASAHQIHRHQIVILFFQVGF